MSLQVLVLSEDPTLDQHILKPIVEKLFDDLGRRARVVVHEPPRGRSRGVDKALDRQNLESIFEDFPFVRLFILLVDRDCHPTRTAAVEAIVQEHADRLVACLAVEEVEVWMLALHRADLGAPWTEVRKECHPKERFATPFLKKRGWTMELGRGRRRAMQDLGAQWAGLLQVCPDIARLRDELTVFLTKTP